MFGGLTSLSNPPGVDIGERMLSAVATQCIRHLFTQSQAVDVNIHCYPSSKLFQGNIDSIKMSGQGLVIRKDFWVESMSFETDSVSLDFGSVLQGRIQLQQPTQAVAQVVLSEAGINQAFTAELVKKHLCGLQLPALAQWSGDQSLSFSDIQVSLLPHNRIRIFANTVIPNVGSVPVSLTATLAIERRRCVVFQDPQFEPNAVPSDLQEISQGLTTAFAQVLNEMVDLDRFNLEGVTMRLNRLETQADKLIFSGYAQIYQFPSMG